MARLYQSLISGLGMRMPFYGRRLKGRRMIASTRHGVLVFAC